jgi:hypothetical protein
LKIPRYLESNKWDLFALNAEISWKDGVGNTSRVNIGSCTT